LWRRWLQLLCKILWYVLHEGCTVYARVPYVLALNAKGIL
jgi:hypothetical protein